MAPSCPQPQPRSLLLQRVQDPADVGCRNLRFRGVEDVGLTGLSFRVSGLGLASLQKDGWPPNDRERVSCYHVVCVKEMVLLKDLQE